MTTNNPKVIWYVRAEAVSTIGNYVLPLALILVVGGSASARFTGFEDLTLGTDFADGETIHSNGLTFQSIALGPQGSNVRVGGLEISGGSGLELAMSSSSSGLELMLPTQTRHISMLFYSGSASAGFIVNGVESPIAGDGDFEGLDGSIVGGVLVTATPIQMPFPRGNHNGRIVLTGDIQSLRLHGSELWIDNVQVSVPEPTLAAFLISANVSSLLFGRRNRAR